MDPSCQAAEAGTVAILLGAVVTSRGAARVAWGALTGLGMLLTVGAQSRAGLVCLVLLAWIAVLRQAVRAARVPWVTALVATALTVGLPLLLLWLRPSASIADAPRMENTRTAARAWADGGPPAVVAGRGSGELWPWLSYEALGVGKPDTFVVASPWGSLLYHPHSTFLGVLTELGIVAAVLGIINTLTLSVIERRQEIGMLRAVGTQRGQVRTMIILESVQIALFGAVMGILIGLGLGWSFIKILGDEGLDSAQIPWAMVLIMLVGSAIVGIIAAVWPSNRAAKTPPLEAIAD